MRRSLMAIGAVAFWLSGSVAQGQTDAEKRAELQKAGVEVYVWKFDDIESRDAVVDCAVAEPHRVAELLRESRNLISITLIVPVGKLSEDHVQMIRELRFVTSLTIQTSQLSEKDLERIASLKQVEGLTVWSREFSPAHLRPLAKMPHLKGLSLRCANRLSPTALADLKMLLKVEALTVLQSPPLVFFPDLVPAPKESQTAKLKREKVNAALSAIRYIDAKIQSGVKDATYGSAESLTAARMLKESILDVDDEAVRTKLIDELVNYLKNAVDATREKLEAGNLDPAKMPLVRYQYLDAQLLQLQLQKKK